MKAGKADRPGAIPDLEDITPDWLSARLVEAGFGGVRLAAVDFSRIGTGQTAACARLSLRYAAGSAPGPASVVAKFPSDNALSRASAVAMGIYRREVEFYRDVAPRLFIALPKIHYAAVDEDGERFLILMEDLAPARPGDQLLGCSAEVVRAAILELVGLQAPTWCDGALARRFAEPPDGYFSDMLGLYRRMRGPFVERYGDRLADDEREIITALGNASGAPLFQPWDAGREPFCLEHRDYRPDNFLIDERCAPPRVVIVDWQGLRSGRPLSDVALCLAGSLEPAERRRVEQEILRDYHAALEAAGVRGFPWEACWQAYRRASFAGFGLTVVASIAVERTERGDAMFTTMARRHARHALDMQADEFFA